MRICMKIDNDKYYTPTETANKCWEKTLEVIGQVNITDIIEPSVGQGAFLNYNILPNTVYDIEPECEELCRKKDITLVRGNYLEQDIEYKKGRLIIGNPPYGDKLNLAQRFFKKSINIGDYVAFILPISQLNNTHSFYEFDLIYSEDLGVLNFTDRKLHCCFNVYKRAEDGKLHKKSDNKLKDITIYRQDKKGYEELEYDIRMCYWGDGSAGKILKDGEHYSAEYKIKINNEELKEEIVKVLSTFDWKNYLKCIAMRKIQQFHIEDVLRRTIVGIK